MTRTTTDRQAVLDVLKSIADPVSGGDIVSSGVVRALNVDDEGAVRFVLEIAPSQAAAFEAVKAAAWLGAISRTKRTAPSSSTFSARTTPLETISPPDTGSAMLLRTSRTACRSV